MKYTAFLVSVVLPYISGALQVLKPYNGSNSKFFDDQFNKTLECLRRILIHGSPDLDVPSLNPWNVDGAVVLYTDNEILSANLTLKNLIIDGITDFETVSLSLSPLFELETYLHFDRIALNASYAGSINIWGLYAAYGRSILTAEFLDVDVNVKMRFEMMPPLLGDNRVHIALKKANIRLTGLLGDEELSLLFSKAVSEVVYYIIKMLHNQISDWISPIVATHFNNFLGHLPFLEFLARITELSC